jgi:uncharacterized protein (TIGR00255 family)
MTGYGQGQAQGGGVRVAIELTSVNRKQLDIGVQIARPLAMLEPWIIEELSRTISRGRVTVQVVVTASGRDGGVSVTVDRARAVAVHRAMADTAKALGLSTEIALADVLRVPGVMAVEEAGHDPEAVRPVLRRALTAAVKSFLAMRAREGRTLAGDLGRRLAAMETEVERIARRAPDLVSSYRDALKARIQVLLGEGRVDDERLEREVVLFADKTDITEEIIRLRSHLAQARRMLKGREPAGRALDFLAQEMFREINTIGSKASDAVVSPLVVHFKTGLERFREQVQNIE